MPDVTFPLPCIVCSKTLMNVFNDKIAVNQPLDGLAFTSHGAYGSSFDPMDSTFLLTVNICDDCLKRGGVEQKVVLTKFSPPTRPVSTNQYWNEDTSNKDF